MTMPKFRPITLTPESLTLEVGEVQTIAAKGGPVKGWTCSNTAVATLAGNGQVRGRSAGTAIVSAKGGPYVAQTTVTVTPLDLEPPPIEPPIEPPVEPPANAAYGLASDTITRASTSAPANLKPLPPTADEHAHR
jgi:hypothetical protein